MVFITPASVAGPARPAARTNSLWLLASLLLFLLLPGRSLAASQSAPTASHIPAVTVYANEAYQYVINGSFSGRDLTYTATLADGSPLPGWLALDADAGSFTATPPSATIANVYKVAVTATDYNGTAAAATFALTVNYAIPGCIVEANTDHLGKILDCRSGTAQLRGYTTAGDYHWTGPNGYTSNEAEPIVTEAGLYSLVNVSDASCPRRALVEVRPASVDCAPRTDNNLIPTGRVLSSNTNGSVALTVQFDANPSDDADGQVIAHLWSWKGGSASGARPRVHFRAGNHEVRLTVMDNTGAKSTTSLTVAVQPNPALTSYWLEAECAQVGTNWTIEKDDNASGQTYVNPTLFARSHAPADSAQNLITFTIDDAKREDFNLYARVSADGVKSDSYWVRVNGGEWYEWSSGIIRGQGFQWNRVRRTFAFQKGSNVIDIALREPDAKLDKLFLTATDQVPGGFGRSARNCHVNEAPLAVARASKLHGEGPLAVTLDGSDSFDPENDRLTYDWSWVGGTATGALPRITLSAGEHAISLTVTDEEGLSSSDVVVIEVSEPIVDDSDVPTEEEPNTDSQPDTEPTLPTYYLEAECALVGSNWSVESDENVDYAVVRSANSTDTAPEDRAANRIRFELDAETTASFSLFARIDAPTNRDDSYWVRINDGEWIEWNSNIEQNKGYRWNKLPATAKLTEGRNTIDFAYREDGTLLDKIMLTATDEVPTLVGPQGQNCQTTVSDYAYEIECAQRGEGWKLKTSEEASQGSYLVFEGSHRLHYAPAADETEQTVKMTVSVTEAGPYTLMLRMNAPTPQQNSFYVSIDDRPYTKFWQEIGGKQLLTDGFEWKPFTPNGEHFTLDLEAGTHTITIANREAGTMLDKIMLSATTDLPIAMGPLARACGPQPGTNTIVRGMMAHTPVSTTTTVSDLTTSVYPNPSVERLNYDIESDYRGELKLAVLDINGRMVKQYRMTKDGVRFHGRVEVADLPAGTYLLRIAEGERMTTEAFAKN